MALSWSSRRKLLYGSVASLFAFSILVWLGFTLLFNAPTCFDKTQNGGETGVDCGGSCSLLCKNETRAPVVLWTRMLQTASTTYTAISYIQNPNAGIGAGTYATPYAFRLYDKDNGLIAEKSGSIDLPPQQTIAIVEPNIDVGNRDVARAFFEFSDNAIWNKIPPASLPKLRIEAQELQPEDGTLTARVVNEGDSDAHTITVAATLFDAGGVAQAASKSVIAAIAPGASQTVTFTWADISSAVRAEIIILPKLSRQPTF